MNGSNGYSPANYGAPPPQPGFGGPQQQAYGGNPASQPAQQSAYGAPPPQQPGYGPSPYGAAPAPAGGYGAPPAYGAAPAPYGAPQYPGQGMNMGTGAAPKSTGLAVALELLGGFFFQTFGVGHLYAGNVGMGLGLMFGYWVLTAINVLLCFVLIGVVTWPLTWLGFMILSSITANNAAKRFNAKAQGLAI